MPRSKLSPRGINPKYNVCELNYPYLHYLVPVDDDLDGVADKEEEDDGDEGDGGPDRPPLLPPEPDADRLEPLQPAEDERVEHGEADARQQRERDERQQLAVVEEVVHVEQVGALDVGGVALKAESI